MTNICVGQGFDVHAFEQGDHLVLGGVRIPHNKAFKAHSDGDVLLHAISDALLGAAALGDIGKHFPDTDPAYRNADSRVLLQRVNELIGEQGWRCGNVDATIIAQAPKMLPYISAMVANIAEDLAIEPSSVNVKATTTEWLGLCGREEGIAAMASATIISTAQDNR